MKLRILLISLVLSLSVTIGIYIRSNTVVSCAESPFNLTVFLPQRETELHITTCLNCSLRVELYDLDDFLNGGQPLLTRNITAFFTLNLLPYNGAYVIIAGPQMHEICIRQHGVEEDNLLYSEIATAIFGIMLMISLVKYKTKIFSNS